LVLFSKKNFFLKKEPKNFCYFGNTIMIIPAGPAHPVIMAEIHAQAFAGGEVWSAPIMAAQLSLPGVFGLLDDRGGMILARVAADEAEILTLGVAPAARRLGVGRALVLEAARVAAERGAGRLLLEVSAANQAARALYESLGFIEAGRRQRYYADGTDAWLLALPLSRGADTPR
jgi:ribosomal-protein-alanine N-acetyltransferase